MKKLRRNNHYRKLSLILLLVLCRWLPAQQDAAADSSGLWGHPEKNTLADKEITFSARNYSNMADGVYFMGRWGEGWLVAINIIHYRSWFVDQWNIQVMLIQPDGTLNEYSATLDDKEPQLSETGLEFRSGPQHLRKIGPDLVLSLELEGFACDLRFSNILNSWAPGGDGYIYHTKNKKIFNYRSVLAPWAQVTGEITTGGRKMTVRGQGYVDRSLGTTPVTALSPYLYAMRVFHPERVPLQQRWHVNFFDTISHKDYDSRRMPYLIIARGGEWLLTTDEYTLDFADFHTHEKSKYDYPQRVIIRSESQGYRFEGQYTVKSLVSYLDFLEEMPEWLRFFVLLFFDRPVRFYFTGTFTGSLVFPDGHREAMSLAGPFTYMIIE